MSNSKHSIKWLWKNFKPYANFKGRAGCEEYKAVRFWLAMPLIFVCLFVALVPAIAYGCVGDSESVLVVFYGALLVALFALSALYVLLFALKVRRIHDLGKSGWFLMRPGLYFLLGGVVIGVFGAVLDACFENADIIEDIITGAVIVLCILGGSYNWKLHRMLRYQDGQVGANKYGPDPKETGTLPQP